MATPPHLGLRLALLADSRLRGNDAREGLGVRPRLDSMTVLTDAV
jgi:hypothetical protein